VVEKGLSLRAIRDRLAEEGVKVSHLAVGDAVKAGA
jgi:transposase-like protein